jgi:phosphate transport system substrate-binding protein
MRVVVSSSSAPLADDLLGEYDRIAPRVALEIARGNAQTLCEAVSSGQADWGLVTYLAVDSDLWSAPIGTDALALVVNPDNPLTGLTRDQVRAIYQGHILTWAALGGAADPILLVSREPDSAARGAFDELVMGGLPTSSAARLATSSEAALAIVAQEPAAIGYVSLALVNERVRTLAIDEVRPSQETARDGPEGPAGDFLRWVLSDEGQAVVGQRYAPLVR